MKYLERLITDLRGPDPETHRRAEDALVEIGAPRALEPMMTALRDTDAVVAWSAARVLSRIGAPAVERLCGALRHPKAEVRWRAGWALGKTGAPAIDALLAALRDPNPEVRLSAARGLGKIGDGRALPELERVAREDWGDIASVARQAIEQIRQR